MEQRPVVVLRVDIGAALQRLLQIGQIAVDYGLNETLGALLEVGLGLELFFYERQLFGQLAPVRKVPSYFGRGRQAVYAVTLERRFQIRAAAATAVSTTAAHAARATAVEIGVDCQVGCWAMFMLLLIVGQAKVAHLLFD